MSTDQIPEPPDGSRIEFEHCTDLYAAWRDDASSREAGWPAGDGGEVWCLYGEDVPVTWAQMCADFGDSLRNLTRLVPVAEGVAAGRKQAADAIQAHIARWEDVPSVTHQERESMRAAARIAEKGSPNGA